MSFRDYKKITLLIVAFLIFSSATFANQVDNTFLLDIENQLFNHSNTQLPLNDRLSKIEAIVLGYASPHDSNEIRIARLKGLLSNDPQQPSQPNNYQNDYPPEFSPLKDNNPSVIDIKANRNKVDRFFQPDKSGISQPQEQPDLSSQPTQPYQDPYSDQEVEDYPAVSLLETKVFNKTFKGEDISKRLDRLEQNVLNTTSPNLALSERLDNLKTAVLGNPNAPLVQENKDVSNDNYVTNYNPGYQNYNNQNGYNNQNSYNNPSHLNPYDYPMGPRHDNIKDDPYNNNMRLNNPNISDNNIDPGESSSLNLLQIVLRMEQQTLGQTFELEPINTRLDRLELHVFNKISPEMNYEDRIERLIAVNNAGETSDPNDLKQINRLRKIQTGLTVGGVLFSILRGFLF